MLAELLTKRVAKRRHILLLFVLLPIAINATACTFYKHLLKNFDSHCLRI